MTKDITVTFTLDVEQNTLKIQATNGNVNNLQLISFIEVLKNKILNKKFMTTSDGSYIEEKFTL